GFKFTWLPPALEIIDTDPVRELLKKEMEEEKQREKRPGIAAAVEQLAGIAGVAAQQSRERALLHEVIFKNRRWYMRYEENVQGIESALSHFNTSGILPEVSLPGKRLIMFVADYSALAVLVPKQLEKKKFRYHFRRYQRWDEEDMKRKRELVTAAAILLDSRYRMELMAFRNTPQEKEALAESAEIIRNMEAVWLRKYI
ncbi:MAG: hypothetical protein QW728_07410, partial [Thermoplasmata archaeon]